MQKQEEFIVPACWGYPAPKGEAMTLGSPFCEFKNKQTNKKKTSQNGQNFLMVTNSLVTKPLQLTGCKGKNNLTNQIYNNFI